MKAVCILVLLIGAFAANTDAAIDLSGITDLLKESGKNLVNAIVEQGKKALASLVGKFLPDIIGKRHLEKLPDFLTEAARKLGTLLEHGKKIAGSVFGKTMDKLKGLVQKFHEKIGMVNKDDVTKQIDDTVDQHDKVQKRILESLIQKGSEIASGFLNKIKGLFGKVKEVAGKVVEHGKNLLSAAKGKVSEVVSGLVQKATDLAVSTGLIGKREVLSLSDHLSKIGSTLSGLFSPFKDIVKSLGTTLKGHFSNLIDTVKGHAVALGGKLKGHVSDLATHGSKLLEHGKNALGAITEVVSDVLKQTVSNAKPSINGVAGVLAGAGKVVLDHFTGADSTGAPAY